MVKTSRNRTITKKGSENPTTLVSQHKISLEASNNSSTPGPHGINYRFIKRIKDKIGGERLVHQIALELQQGHTPIEWQASKAVGIPKREKNPSRQISI